MKQFLLDFYQRLGINKAMAEDLEAITFAMIIFVLALGIWLVTRRVFRLIFLNISKKILYICKKKLKSKLNDKNKKYTVGVTVNDPVNKGPHWYYYYASNSAVPVYKEIAKILLKLNIDLIRLVILVIS